MDNNKGENVKTAELTGAHLDYWVAMAEGMQHVRINRDVEPHACLMWQSERDMRSGNAWSPSTSWQQGGPIIERERIQIAPVCREWLACHEAGDYRAATPLQAAMRVYVACKFGDEVPDEVA